MKKKSAILSVLLLIVVVISMITSCGGGGVTPEQATQTASAYNATAEYGSNMFATQLYLLATPAIHKKPGE